MNALELFAAPAFERLGLALLHFLWQGAAVATLTAHSAGLLRRGSRRYAAYLVGLVLMALCPVITYWLVDMPQPVAAAAIASAAQPLVLSAPAPVGLSISADQPTARSWTQRLSDSLPVWLPWAVAIWSAGVAVLSLRLLVGIISLRRWRRGIQPLPQDLLSRVAVLSDRLGLKDFARVFGSGMIHEPLALGCWRPMVLVPLSLLTAMQPEMLETVIAHELGHIRRQDLWVNLAQRVIETLLFYHPAVWWLSGRLRNERELCCDELAVSATGRRVEYAQALEQVARGNLAGAEPALAAALGHERRALLSRVRHVLGTPSPGERWTWPAGVVGILVVLLCVVGVGMSRSAQVSADAAATTQPVEAPKLIGPGDHILVKVWDLSVPGKADEFERAVPADGTIKLDPADHIAVKVLGLSEAEAELAIQKAYRDAKLMELANVECRRLAGPTSAPATQPSAGPGGAASATTKSEDSSDAKLTALADMRMQELAVLSNELTGAQLATIEAKRTYGPRHPAIASAQRKEQEISIQYREKLHAQLELTNQLKARQQGGPQPQTAAPSTSTTVPASQPDSIGLDEARRLWVSAIDAEARRDFPLAIRLFKEIKQLPREVWPAGLQLRLDQDEREADSGERVYYISGVKNQGTFPLRQPGPLRLSKALANADLRGKAIGQLWVVIHHQALDKPAVEILDLEQALADKSASTVGPGDVLMITAQFPQDEQLPVAGMMYRVAGDVPRPGNYPLRPAITVLQALVAAGINPPEALEWMVQISNPRQAVERKLRIGDLLGDRGRNELVFEGDKLIVQKP